MFLGYRQKLFFVFALIFFELSLVGQNVQESSYGNYYLKADTTYKDTVIGGRDVVIRNITIYDTVYVLSNMKYRNCALAFTQPSILLDSLHEMNIVAPGYSNWDFEAGLSYGVGMPFQFIHGNSLQKNAVRSVNYYEGFLHGSRYYNNWYVKSGVNLSFSNEHDTNSQVLSGIDSSDVYVFTYDSLFIDTSYFIDLTQLPDTVYQMIITHIPDYPYHDTIYRKYRQKVNRSAINRYFRVGVPLLMGYVVNLRKFDIAFEGGVYFNMLVSVNGKANDYYNNIRQLREKYFYRLTADATLRIQFRYKLKSLRYLTFTPLMRYNLIDTYKNTNFPKNKILSFRFAFGYNFH